MIQPIGIGVVGLGRMGEFHLKKLKESSLFRCAGFFDPNKKRAEEISRFFELPYFETLSELFSVCEALVVASPTPTHYTVAKEALEEGLHVFIEKPMTVALAEAKILLSLAENNKKVIQVGFVERFRLRKFLEKVSLPQNILHVEIKRLTPRAGRDLNTNIVLDLMIHDLDLLDMVVEGSPIETSAVAKCLVNATEDWVLASFKFAKGVTVSAEAFRYASELRRTLRVVGEEKELLFNFQTNTVLERNYNHPDTQMYVVEVDAIQLEHDDFHQSITTQTPAFSSGKKGVKALELTHQVLEACKIKS